MTADTLLATLADVLARENEALRDLDMSTAASLAAEKQAVISALDAVPAPTQPPHPASGQSLRALVTENQALLERAIRVQARVIEIVASAYKPAPGMRTYGPSGGQPAIPLSGVALSTRA